MPEFFDYNPKNGMTRSFEECGDKLFIHAAQDVEPILERNLILRNEGIADKGIKKDWWIWATIPDSVYLQLRARGINMFSRDPAEQRRFRKIINAEYPKLKTTYKTHV